MPELTTSDYTGGTGAVIDLQEVSKYFLHRPALFNLLGKERSGRTIALNDVSFSIGRGEVVALLGANGSGKTTLLKLIGGMLLPDAGRVVVAGADTSSHIQQVRRVVGFAFAHERSFFPRLTSRENLDFFATLDDVSIDERRPRIAELLRALDMSAVEDTLVYKFSSGMFQKLGIIRALVKRPEILLLDEPTRSIDPAAAQQFWLTVRAFVGHGITVMLATHNFDEVSKVADRVVVLSAGRVVGDREMAAVSTAELRDFYFGTTQEPAFAVSSDDCREG